MVIEDLPSRRDDIDWRPPRPLADEVDRVLAGLGAPPAPVLTVLAEQWATIVGPVAAEHCTPNSLVDGRLRVDVDEPAWASQMTWQESDLLDRIQELVPGAHVRKLQVRVSYAP